MAWGEGLGQKRLRAHESDTVLHGGDLFVHGASHSTDLLNAGRIGEWMGEETKRGAEWQATGLASSWMSGQMDKKVAREHGNNGARWTLRGMLLGPEDGFTPKVEC